MNFWNWIGLPSAADIRELQELSLRQTDELSTLTKLNKNVTQLLRSTQDISEGNDKLADVAYTYYKDISKMILERTKAIDLKLGLLKTLQQDFQTMDKETQRRLERVLKECENENELLRLLIANSLIDDVSEVMNKNKQLPVKRR